VISDIATILRAIIATTSEKSDIETSDRGIIERLQRSVHGASERKEEPTEILASDQIEGAKRGAVGHQRATTRIA
jgi:hypothetical protein